VFVEILKRNHYIKNINETLIKTFLELVILKRLQNKPMTGYEINSQLEKEFRIMISPNVIYTRLSKMEREGLITCILRGSGRSYFLTNDGLLELNDFPNIKKKINQNLSFIF
jgi:DNA-binding PadR family transcriptional regulator